jgi:hypothetical protein
VATAIFHANDLLVIIDNDWEHGHPSWLGMVPRLQLTAVLTYLSLKFFSLSYLILFLFFALFLLMRGARILSVGGRCYDLPYG